MRIKLDIRAEKFGQLGIFSVATMRQSYARRHKAGSGQVSAETNQYGRKKFDLVTIQMAADPHIAEGYTDVIAARVLQRNAFIGDRAITRKLVQCLAQSV
jgi:hypothetical protein